MKKFKIGNSTFYQDNTILGRRTKRIEKAKSIIKLLFKSIILSFAFYGLAILLTLPI